MTEALLSPQSATGLSADRLFGSGDVSFHDHKVSTLPQTLSA